MPSNTNRRRSRSPELARALERMKWETAQEIGTPTHLVQGDYWGNVSSRDCGTLGGNMVRKMIEAAEASLIASMSAGVSRGFHEVVGAAAASHLHRPPGWHLDPSHDLKTGTTATTATTVPTVQPS
ncbi:MAG: alpha/beta-type small acid-soluble spore protein [Bacillota bacterium]|jgi:small acid-soluble spore protein A (major alpha-type SASP)|nr:alpha/beta-type small acid-soluble spore protein [Bacillota bacterium]